MPEPADPDALFSPLVEHAIELAAQWHDGTYRKSMWREPAFALPPDEEPQVPVMAHLTAVATTVQRAGWPDAVVAAAFVHDALEDPNRHGQRLRARQLRDALGEEVTALVQAVSEQKLDDAGVHRSWDDRKTDYVAHLEGEAPAAAVAISLADKLHNLWSMNQALASGTDIFTSAPGRQALSAGPKAQRWFHRAVLDASHAHDDPRLAPMRGRLARELERFCDLTGAAPADE